MVVLEPSGHVEETGYCHVCRGTKLITDSHSCELICTNCGLVISNRVEYELVYEGSKREVVDAMNNIIRLFVSR
jgi:transcription initiation factor TFIIIB Brf1 subunit/transcription initiation factor TFIIB